MRDILPIQSEEAYQQVMAEIDTLILAVPDTPEGDRLEVLAVLADEWDRRDREEV